MKATEQAELLNKVADYQQEISADQEIIAQLSGSNDAFDRITVLEAHREIKEFSNRIARIARRLNNESEPGVPTEEAVKLLEWVNSADFDNE